MGGGGWRRAGGSINDDPARLRQIRLAAPTHQHLSKMEGRANDRHQHPHRYFRFTESGQAHVGKTYPQIYSLDPLDMLTDKRMLTAKKGRNAVKLTEEERAVMRRLGQMGGTATAKKLSKAERQQRAKAGAAARWKGHKKKDR